jgi:hypothetical protein
LPPSAGRDFENERPRPRHLLRAAPACMVTTLRHVFLARCSADRCSSTSSRTSGERGERHQGHIGTDIKVLGSILSSESATDQRRRGDCALGAGDGGRRMPPAFPASRGRSRGAATFACRSASTRSLTLG